MFRLIGALFLGGAAFAAENLTFEEAIPVHTHGFEGTLDADSLKNGWITEKSAAPTAESYVVCPSIIGRSGLVWNKHSIETTSLSLQFSFESTTASSSSEINKNTFAVWVKDEIFTAAKTEKIPELFGHPTKFNGFGVVFGERGSVGIVMNDGNKSLLQRDFTRLSKTFPWLNQGIVHVLIKADNIEGISVSMRLSEADGKVGAWIPVVSTPTVNKMVPARDSVLPRSFYVGFTATSPSGSNEDPFFKYPVTAHDVAATTALKTIRVFDFQSNAQNETVENVSSTLEGYVVKHENFLKNTKRDLTKLNMQMHRLRQSIHLLKAEVHSAVSKPGSEGDDKNKNPALIILNLKKEIDALKHASLEKDKQYAASLDSIHKEVISTTNEMSVAQDKHVKELKRKSKILKDSLEGHGTWSKIALIGAAVVMLLFSAASYIRLNRIEKKHIL